MRKVTESLSKKYKVYLKINYNEESDETSIEEIQSIFKNKLQ